MKIPRKSPQRLQIILSPSTKYVLRVSDPLKAITVYSYYMRKFALTSATHNFQYGYYCQSNGRFVFRSFRTVEAAVQTVADLQGRVPGTRGVPRRSGFAIPVRGRRPGQPVAVVAVVSRPPDGRIGQRRHRRRQRRRRRRVPQKAQPHDPLAPDTAHLRAGRAFGRFSRGQTLPRDHRGRVVVAAGPTRFGRPVLRVPERGRYRRGRGLRCRRSQRKSPDRRPRPRELQRALRRDVLLHDKRGRGRPPGAAAPGPERERSFRQRRRDQQSRLRRSCQFRAR